MAAGSIRAEIKLEHPKRMHYGNDTVTGNIVLRFVPQLGTTTQESHSSTEFFGPMKISVTFHGRLKSKVKKSNGNSSSTYRGRVPLFNHTFTIFDDSAKIAKGEKWPVPFAFTFPEGFQTRIVDGDWEADPKYDTRQCQPLPPSFMSNYAGFSNHYESFIEYRVGVAVRVPHLPVNVLVPDKDAEPYVQYRPPRLQSYSEPKSYRNSQTVAISNELLLPEEDRPTGFRQKTKAKLSSDFFPHYKFDWFVIAPQHIYIGQPIPFEVFVRPRDDTNTAIVIPDVLLTSFSVTLKSNTNVRAEKQFFTCPEASHEDELRSFRAVYDSKAPFSKAQDWSKTINTAAVPEELTHTFRTVNISHTHSMKVSFSMRCAEKIISWNREYPVIVLPPVDGAETQAGASGFSAAAGSSTQPLDMAPVEEALPRYEEGLPEYHEATAIAPAPLPKDEGTSGTASATAAA